ncbi:MAG: hypothetical protein P3C10_07215 [Gemmatimonadota bacterium]|nr:hypothetical protein [Gemmatimonadota bacterium]
MPTDRTAPPVGNVSHPLPRPTHAAMLVSLARYLGADEATEAWDAACRETGVDPDGSETSPDELLRVVGALDVADSLVATCAASLRIRLMSYILVNDLGVNDLGRSPAP